MPGTIGNKNALKYKNEKDLEEAINKYFIECDEKDKPYTISGLALSLGIDRRTLVNYGERESFFPLIKNAKAKVETMLEENLYRLGNNSGIIFNLKNNYGWTDKQEQEVALTNRFNIINDLPKEEEDE